MRYPVLAGDVAETLQALSVEEPAVIGHSMGGAPAMALALRRPDKIERVMIGDIAPVPHHHGNAALTAWMWL